MMLERSDTNAGITCALRKAIRHVALRAGLQKKVTVHSLRHSLATPMLSLRTIQQLHSQLCTTTIYTEVLNASGNSIVSLLD